MQGLLVLLCFSTKQWTYSSPQFNLCDTIKNSTVAINLIGQPFRSGEGEALGTTNNDLPCIENSIDSQLEAYESVQKNIVNTLEHCGATVNVIITSLKSCKKLTKKVVHRVFKKAIVLYSSWNDMYEGALHGYNNVMKTSKTNKIDFVFTLRQDVYISQPVSKFPTTLSWDTVLFEQICRNIKEKDCLNCACSFNNILKKGHNRCTKDHMWWSPFHYFEQIGRNSGHYMIKKASLTIPQEKIGFLFPHDYCHRFLTDFNLHPNVGQKNALNSWYNMSQEYKDVYFHLLCIQEFAYRPMRRYSKSMDSWIY